MAEDGKRELCELERQENAEAEKTELEKAEPWRGIMSDVGKMMQAALEEAQDIAEKHREVAFCSYGEEYATNYSELHGRPRRLPGTDSIIRMAVAIFDATAAAEAGRRMLEAQQGGLVAGAIIPAGKPPPSWRLGQK